MDESERRRFVSPKTVPLLPTPDQSQKWCCYLVCKLWCDCDSVCKICLRFSSFIVYYVIVTFSLMSGEECSGTLLLEMCLHTFCELLPLVWFCCARDALGSRRSVDYVVILRPPHCKFVINIVSFVFLWLSNTYCQFLYVFELVWIVYMKNLSVSRVFSHHIFSWFVFTLLVKHDFLQFEPSLHISLLCFKRLIMLYQCLTI